MKQGVQQAALESGLDVQLVEGNSGGDVTREDSFVRLLVTDGVDAVIISTVSADESVAAVKRAADAGIPVICYDTCIDEEAMQEDVTAWIWTDHFKVGELLGEYAADFYATRAGHYASKGIHEPRIGMLACPRTAVCKDRGDGFEAGLSTFAGAEVTSADQVTVDHLASMQGESILSDGPVITGMYGQSVTTTIGAVESIRNLDRTGVTFAFGSDMSTDVASELKDGSILQAVVDVSGIEVGRLALDQAQDAINGTKPEDKTIPAPIKLYTPATAQDWLDTHPDGIP